MILKELIEQRLPDHMVEPMLSFVKNNVYDPFLQWDNGLNEYIEDEEIEDTVDDLKLLYTDRYAGMNDRDFWNYYISLTVFGGTSDNVIIDAYFDYDKYIEDIIKSGVLVITDDGFVFYH